MQAGESEEENGVGQSSGHSAVQGLPWWGGIGHHPLHTTSSSPAKLSYIENPSLVTATARPLGLIHPTTMQQPQGQSLSQTFSEGQGTNLVAPPVQSLSHSDYGEGGGINHHQESAAPGVFATLPGEYLFPHTQLELGPSMAGAVYPYADPYFGGIVAAYGAQAMIHPHMLGVQQARMPLPSEEVEEEPVYVNAKQYHGILRRRQSRAKAESENKLIKSRKPYLHESRHLHAMKRARGCGGRFLNKKSKESKSNTDSNKSSEGQSSQGGNTPDSHAIQLEHSVPGSQDTYAQTEQGLRGQAAARRAQPGLSGVSYYPETFSHGGHPMVSSGTVHGGYHSHQNQTFHSPAFQPSPAASDEGDSGRSGDIMSNGSQ